MDILNLEPTQSRKAAEVVSSAFFHYPMITHYFPDPEKRKRWMPWHMEKIFVMGYRNYIKSDECENFVANTQERLMNGRDHYYLWGLVADSKT